MVKCINVKSLCCILAIHIQCMPTILKFLKSRFFPINLDPTVPDLDFKWHYKVAKENIVLIKCSFIQSTKLHWASAMKQALSQALELSHYSRHNPLWKVEMHLPLWMWYCQVLALSSRRKACQHTLPLVSSDFYHPERFLRGSVS